MAIVNAHWIPAMRGPNDPTHGLNEFMLCPTFCERGCSTKTAASLRVQLDNISH